MAKSTMKRNPKGMGHYFMTPTGKYGWRQRVDGQERTLTADTAKELQEKINEVRDLKIIRNKVTVDEVFKKYLNYIGNLRKDATYQQYSIIYEQHIKPAIGKRKIKSITSSDVQDVILAMNKKTTKIRKKKNGKWIEVDTEKTLSTCTMKHALKIMRGGFAYAIKKEKVMSINPTTIEDEKIEIPKKQPKERKVLNHDELKRLFQRLESSRWSWSAKFMLITGLRRGELLALRWSNVDFINKRITVDESNSSTGLNDTKSSKIHYIPLSPLMEKYLVGQKQMLEDEANPILYNEKLKKENLVFPSKNGTMLQAGSYYTMFSRYAKNVGIEASPHCLRHTFVYMNRKKLSLKEIQNILGHDESTTTLDIYGDMIDESTEQTAKDIDETFADLDKSISETKEKEYAKVIDFNKYRSAK